MKIEGEVCEGYAALLFLSEKGRGTALEEGILRTHTEKQVQQAGL